MTEEKKKHDKHIYELQYRPIYYQNNREAEIARAHEYWEQNKEMIRKKQRERYRRLKYHDVSCQVYESDLLPNHDDFNRTPLLDRQPSQQEMTNTSDFL